MIDLSKKKVAFLDLDDTLIKTASGKTFPRSVADFVIRLDVLKKLKALELDVLLIVTNQGGIPKFCKEWEFKAKIRAVKSFVEGYVGVPVLYKYCVSLDKSHPMRKPNTGMLEDLFAKASANRGDGAPAYEKSEAFYVGDASGIHTDGRDDYSDDDIRCAEAFGVEYVDVEEFVEG